MSKKRVSQMYAVGCTPNPTFNPLKMLKLTLPAKENDSKSFVPDLSPYCVFPNDLKFTAYSLFVYPPNKSIS